MKGLLALIRALSLPLMTLNALGGVVSGIWLAILRDWSVVGLGIILWFISTKILVFALIPSMLLITPAALFAEGKKTLGVVLFVSLSNLYTFALMTVWCCGILFLFFRGATPADGIPRLIWSYGIAIGPWAYMAEMKSMDQSPSKGINTAALAVFLGEIAYVVLILIILFSGISLFGALTIFGGFMFLSFVIQVTFLVRVLIADGPSAVFGD